MPSSGLELGQRGRKVVHPIDEDRPIALDVICEHEERRAAGQPDRRDPGPAGLDGEDQLATQDVGEVRGFDRDIVARAIQEVELRRVRPSNLELRSCGSSGTPPTPPM